MLVSHSLVKSYGINIFVSKMPFQSHVTLEKIHVACDRPTRQMGFYSAHHTVFTLHNAIFYAEQARVRKLRTLMRGV